MPDYRRLRSNRAFKLLLGGSSVSMLGSRLTTIAYPMLVLSLHGSPVIAGLAVFAANAPSVLVYIPAGALVDRWDPRKTLVLAEAGRGAAITFIVVLLLARSATVPLVIAAAILEESLEVFALLAERRYVRDVVEPPQAPSALVSIETRTHVVVLIGRAFGGLLFGIHRVVPFLVDAATFLVSVISLLLFRPDQQPAPKREHDQNLVDEMKDGLSTLWRDRFARDASLLSAGLTLVSQALIIMFLAGAHSRQVSAVAVGGVLAASGIGGVLGALTARSMRFPGSLSPLKIQPVVWAVMLALFAMSGRWQVPVMALLMTVLGFFGAMSNVELDNYLIWVVPKTKLARVTSIGMLFDFTACAIGPALGGLLYGSGFAVWLLFALTVPCVWFGLRMRVPLPWPPASAVVQGRPPAPLRVPTTRKVFNGSHPVSQLGGAVPRWHHPKRSRAESIRG
jgi:MFS family permease